MTHGKSLLPEIDQEMKVTRRLLERVPGDKMQWKPHPKSFPLGHLTQLVCWMPGWITNAVTQSKLDIGGGSGYSFETPETLLAEFDRNVAAARAALEQWKEAEVDDPWSLMMGDKVLFSTTKRTVVRQTISHFVHHRGQLTVYLRLLDVPLPSIYGPTADDRSFG